MCKDRAIIFILFTLMIDAIGVGIVFPIMPDLMERVGANDTGQGALWGGILMATYALGLFLFGPIIGSISDTIGRRPVLLLALSMLTIEYIIMAMTTSFWLLFTGRTLAGLAGATYATATAYVADISSPQKKAANFGLIGAAFGLGFVLGPALGGLAAELSITAPFWISASLCALNAVFGYFALPESLVKNKRRKFKKLDLNPFQSILTAFRLPGLALPLTSIFIFEFANLVYPTIWAFWLREVFAWPTIYIGLSLAAYGLLLVLVQGALLPFLISFTGEYKTILLGVGAAVVGMIGFGFTTTITAMIIFLVTAALSDLLPPLLTAITSNATDDERQGVVQGVIAALSSLAAVISPVLMTGLFHMSVDSKGVYFPGAPFIFSSFLILLMIPLVRRIRPR